MDKTDKQTKLHIVFRTCDKVDSLHGLKRPFNLTKKEVIKACFKSIYNAIPDSKNTTITVFGDDLSEESLKFFEQFKDVKVMQGKWGNDDSLRECFKFINQLPEEDIAYLVEDDYLHIPNALPLSAHFAQRWDCFVHPTDYPDRYTRTEDLFKRWLILPGLQCHFREIKNTTFTFMGTVKNFKKNMEVFEKSCEKANDGYLSDNLKSALFSPLPGLATHMHEGVMSLYGPWQEVLEALK